MRFVLVESCPRTGAPGGEFVTEPRAKPAMRKSDPGLLAASMKGLMYGLSTQASPCTPASRSSLPIRLVAIHPLNFGGRRSLSRSILLLESANGAAANI